MDLHFNSEARFTRWVVQKGLLQSPFVLIDVGVMGGEPVRWSPLGDYLVVHGFDAIEEEIDRLARENRANRHYHWIAAGNEDGERDFHFNAGNPSSSSFYPHGQDRVHHYGYELREVVRRVPVRRLDTLLAQGAIPPADFMKIDVEGFEKSVLDGARGLLGREMLGVETETCFAATPACPEGHFATLHRLLREHHLVAHDLAYNRVPRESFQKAVAGQAFARAADQASVGRVTTINALFLRDVVEEAEHPHHYPTPPKAMSAEKILKAMVIHELYGLNDIAVDIATRFQEALGARLDVARAIDLLIQPGFREIDLRALLADAYARATAIAEETKRRDAQARSAVAELQQRIRALETSTSWRVTAPLRWLRTAVKKRPG